MKPTKLIAKLFLAAVICSAIPAASAQELVVNGGFESGNLNGWNLIDTDGFSGVDNNAAFAFEGTHYAFLGAETTIGSLSQTINTIAGQTYTFSFALGNDFTPGGSDSNFFAASFGTQEVLRLQNASPSDPEFSYDLYSFQVTATSNQTTIQFQYQHGNDFWRLDSVSVVPEPSTYALLGMAAVGGLVAMRRRARRAAASRA